MYEREVSRGESRLLEPCTEWWCSGGGGGVGAVAERDECDLHSERGRKRNELPSVEGRGGSAEGERGEREECAVGSAEGDGE